MKTSSAKAKGRRCAQEVQAHILRLFPDLHMDDIVVASAGQTGEDIILSRDARSRVPLSIECKNVEALNVWKALEQAESNAGKHQPALFFRRNRSKLYVAVEAGYFLELLKVINEPN